MGILIISLVLFAGFLIPFILIAIRERKDLNTKKGYASYAMENRQWYFNIIIIPIVVVIVLSLFMAMVSLIIGIFVPESRYHYEVMEDQSIVKEKAEGWSQEEITTIIKDADHAVYFYAVKDQNNQLLNHWDKYGVTSLVPDKKVKTVEFVVLEPVYNNGHKDWLLQFGSTQPLCIAHKIEIRYNPSTVQAFEL